jgi:hypothetical protein
MVKPTLESLGQISDIHLNARHYTLSRSKLAVLEGAGASGSGTKNVGDKLCHAFIAVHDLVKNMATGANKAPKADAIFFTGDYHDNSRSLDPYIVQTDLVKDHWSAYNILNNLDNKDVYKRGMDHILMHTLILDSYRSYNVPCFVLRGNHEPYRMSYGVSPRVQLGSWAFWMGACERLGIIDTDTLSDRLKQKSFFDELFFEKEDSGKKSANKWLEGKGDEGIPADHNLTCYEICLAYGPTYGQALTGKNFYPQWYDWVDYLLTPWTNWYFEHKGSQYVGLGWGQDETFTAYKNLLPGASAEEQQGKSFLSRSGDMIDDIQKAMIEQGQQQKGGKQLYVFTHYTVVSFHQDEGFFTDPECWVNNLIFCPIYEDTGVFPYKFKGIEEAGWNRANWGTFQTNQPWYFKNCVSFQGEPKGNGITAPACTRSPKAKSLINSTITTPVTGKRGHNPTKGFSVKCLM